MSEDMCQREVVRPLMCGEIGMGKVVQKVSTKILFILAYTCQ
jgi:hypothetical protein